MPSAQNNSANNQRKPAAARPCQHRFRTQGMWRVCSKCGARKPLAKPSPG